jgi:hypothetical protein
MPPEVLRIRDDFMLDPTEFHTGFKISTDFHSGSRILLFKKGYANVLKLLSVLFFKLYRPKFIAY